MDTAAACLLWRVEEGGQGGEAEARRKKKKKKIYLQKSHLGTTGRADGLGLLLLGGSFSLILYEVEIKRGEGSA